MNILHHDQPFHLEKGGTLPYLDIAYHTYGTYNPLKNNVIWVCHALTANSDVFDWWAGLFGENDFFNPDDYFIICANVIGSCYGTTSPLNTSKEKRFHNFPKITIRDMVNAHEILRVHLEIDKIFMVLGGSLGGQQALEWAVQHPDLFEHLGAIATNAQHSPWGIAYNESQRMAIRVDPTWKESHPDAGKEGMKVARSMALISYRAYHTYGISQRETDVNKTEDFRASSYQRYQGEKLARRFDAFAYYSLSLAMDTHNLGRGRNTIEQALQRIQAKTIVIGISSDGLFPPSEQKYLVTHIPDAIYEEIDSHYGHDGFLVETQKLADIFKTFLKKTTCEWVHDEIPLGSRH